MSDPKLKHFLPYEFECQCKKCEQGYEQMRPEFLLQIDNARELSGVVWHLTSAYRCPNYNQAVGGVDGSAHTRGYAVDVAASGSRQREAVLRGAALAGIQRIGIASTFIHLDADPSKPQQVAWLYD